MGTESDPGAGRPLPGLWEMLSAGDGQALSCRSRLALRGGGRDVPAPA